jgi:chlorobactene glucosyltransferase
MMDLRIILQFVSVAFLVGALLIALGNLRGLRRLRDYPAPVRFPRVCVLVPARNEEGNIAPCVRSLMAQNYPDFEVVVLDDESTDGTWDVLARLAEESPRLRVLRGRPLPGGWIGKNWACHQLARAADGELLLFTDADTRHAPDTLQRAVAAFQAEGADFLTALPREEARSFGEKLTVPIIPFGINSFLPVARAHRSRAPYMSIAVGQFMLFSRRAYDAVGGNKAVRDHVLDDVALGRRIKAAGMRWRIVDASEHVECRMYRSLAEVFAGFSKNIFATFDSNVLVYIPVWLLLSAVFILPVYLLVAALLGDPLPGFSVPLAWITVGLALLLWGISHARFGYPLYMTFLYPVSVALWVLIALRSMVMTLTGRNRWKGRSTEFPAPALDEAEEQGELKRRTG